MLKLSVIVPIYNVAPYVEECVESIENSTYSNLQVILVDDGSTDISGEICNRLADLYKNVIVIHKQNGGLVSARKTGVSKATGDYITFVDGDDYIKTDLYENLMNIANNTNVDIVCFGCTSVYDDNTQVISYPELNYGFYDQSEIRQICMPATLYDYSFNAKLASGVCLKVFKRDIFYSDMCLVSERVSFNEDALFSLIAMHRANSLWIDNENVGYYYRIRNDSMSHCKNNESYVSRLVFLQEFEKLTIIYPYWKSWDNFFIEKLAITLYAIENNIAAFTGNVYLMSKNIKDIIIENNILYEGVSEIKLSRLSISYFYRILTFFLKYHFYMCAAIIIKLKQVKNKIKVKNNKQY